MFRRRFLLVVVFVLYGCENVYVPELDNLLIIGENGNELCPIQEPTMVVCNGTCNDFNGEWFTDGLDWWNYRIPESFVSLGNNEDNFNYHWNSRTENIIFVAVENILTFHEDDYNNYNEDPGGRAWIDYDENGIIIRSIIVINHLYAYDEETIREVFKHELGHTRGFDDDAGPPMTVDLNSIMGSPTPSRGVLLESDREYFEEVCLGL